MNLDSYRIYRNRPKPLMGVPIVYYISDKDSTRFDIEEAIHEKHPNLSEIKTVRVGNWRYMGVITGGRDD